MTDYTKGPWQIVMVGDSNPKPAVATSDMLSVLTIAWEDEAPFAAVFEEADANLIAAAPDLLEALSLLYGHLFGPSPSMSRQEIDDLCVSAIAKAEGRSR